MKKYWLILLGAVLVVSVAPGLFADLKEGVSDKQAVIMNQGAVFADPDNQVTSLGGTATQIISDCSSTSEGYYHRLAIQNTHASNNFCFCYVAAGTTCASACDCDMSGTDDGNLIQAKGARSGLLVACDLRICGVAGATSTLVHVEREVIP